MDVDIYIFYTVVGTLFLWSIVKVILSNLSFGDKLASIIGIIFLTVVVLPFILLYLAYFIDGSY
ncbi:hypothetical protein P4493_06185 [Bacillus thuringiensis]|uniref:Membrane protein n=3 Tax=Bacillus thuringiensis TaxID=1428 RepID=A0A0B5NPS7_BACTU|nr:MULTISPECIES: hypothetical protein [Bacillus]EAO56533.1 hypothetical protein RBTH_05468 [Bacillus thuringiensis serovar israelensis ATCC 35646]MEC3431394.1 hypothetical protein [Bacillus cereus]MED1153867.1 hypothetical protein [Bacillus paranthracis]OUB09282.1 hypothetical protein BK708_32655 [Bacillus thuringiensis serovar yunnanensis]AFQ30176.1 hypothetical protein BTF1_30377 [Bacillus thuringiensis HD-789]